MCSLKWGAWIQRLISKTRYLKRCLMRRSDGERFLLQQYEAKVLLDAIAFGKNL
jgi:hypothetical protein